MPAEVDAGGRRAALDLDLEGRVLADPGVRHEVPGDVAGGIGPGPAVPQPGAVGGEAVAHAVGRDGVVVDDVRHEVDVAGVSLDLGVALAVGGVDVVVEADPLAGVVLDELGERGAVEEGALDGDVRTLPVMSSAPSVEPTKVQRSTTTLRDGPPVPSIPRRSNSVSSPSCLPVPWKRMQRTITLEMGPSMTTERLRVRRAGPG